MKYLIVIDMQEDFTRGVLGTPEAIAVIDKIKEKIEKNNYDEIIFTRDTHLNETYLNTQEGKFLPIPHCDYNSEGWQIVKELRDCPFVLDKPHFGFLGWKYILNNFTDSENTIEIVGVCTDICVISNALILKAQFPEIPIIVDAECCAGTTPEMHKKALDVMKSCQIYVINE